jgi:hypothetical protein
MPHPQVRLSTARQATLSRWHVRFCVKLGDDLAAQYDHLFDWLIATAHVAISESLLQRPRQKRCEPSRED